MRRVLSSLLMLAMLAGLAGCFGFGPWPTRSGAALPAAPSLAPATTLDEARQQVLVYSGKLAEAQARYRWLEQDAERRKLVALCWWLTAGAILGFAGCVAIAVLVAPERGHALMGAGACVAVAACAQLAMHGLDWLLWIGAGCLAIVVGYQLWRWVRTWHVGREALTFGTEALNNLEAVMPPTELERFKRASVERQVHAGVFASIEDQVKRLRVRGHL